MMAVGTKFDKTFLFRKCHVASRRDAGAPASSKFPAPFLHSFCLLDVLVDELHPIHLDAPRYTVPT